MSCNCHPQKKKTIPVRTCCDNPAVVSRTEFYDYKNDIKDQLEDIDESIKTADESITKINESIDNIETGKQNKLVAGTNVTLVDNTDDTTTINAEIDTNNYYNKTEIQAIANTKQDKLTAGANINIASNIISAVDTTYSAGQGIVINGQNVISTIMQASNYYDKNEVDRLIDSVDGATMVVVTALPATGDDKTIYLLENAGGGYDQWIYSEGQWHNIGNTSVSLDDYYTKTQTDNLLSTKQGTLVAGAGITITGNTISSEGEKYYAGDNITIDGNNVISAKDTTYTAGHNINIDANNVISTTAESYTAGDGIEITSANVIKNLIDISNYYDKTEVDELIAGMTNLRLQVVPILPAIGIPNVIYLVKRAGVNVYDQWIYTDDTWSNIGDTSIDLSQYYTKSETYSRAETNTLLDNYYNKTETYSQTEVDNILNDYYKKTETYSQTEVDTLLDDYYKKTETYSQTEVDDLLDEKQDLLSDDADLVNPADVDILSSVNLGTKKVRKITFANIWNWIVSKATQVISSASTHTEIPTTKAVYDYIESKAKYLHILTCYNNNSFDYPMWSVYVITTNATETYATIATWLYSNNHRSLQTAYPWISGVGGTKEITTPSGNYHMGVPISGAYTEDGTTIKGKANYNAQYTPASDRFSVKSIRLN